MVAVDRSDADMADNPYPRQIRKEAETWRLNDNEVVDGVHSWEMCTEPCALHSPTDHHMRDMMLHFRDDRGIFERICEHGVGHPDPDQYEWLVAQQGKDNANTQYIHGCDGCCAERKAFG